MKPNIDNISYQQKEYDPKMKQNKTFLVLGIFLIFAATFGFDWLLRFFNNLPYPQTSGEFGDQFGVLNSLFSGLAFVILIYTLRQQEEQIRLQREDLQNQKEDLKLQREEMQRQCAEQKRQADEFEAQNKLMKIQQFDSFFFNSFNNIINIKKEIVSISIKYEYNPKIKENALELIFLIIGDYSVECDQNHEYNTITIAETIKKIIPKITPLIKSLHITTKLILKNEHLSKEQIQNYLDMIFGIFTEEESRAVDFFWHYLNYDLIENLEHRKSIISYSEKAHTEKIISCLKSSPKRIGFYNT